MPFNPKQEYLIVETKVKLKDFFDYKDDYITRPPYQRKSVWPRKKQQGLFDSLFRRYYVPRLVIREVRLSDEHTVQEIIDGQQRINAIQEFFEDKFPLPDTLSDIHSELPGKIFSQLPSELRKFIDKELFVNADVVKNIENPRNPEHQKVATEIFWRLQEGAPLNFMEKSHARLSSLSRNFIVKYGDDETFDFEKYRHLDVNPDKNPFFRLLDRNNDRMQHLMLLARLLMIEHANGFTELKDKALIEFIDKFERPDGIGNYTLEGEAFAKNCLSTLELLHSVFREDPMIDSVSGIKELKIEYLIISLYLLVRHLKNHYVIGNPQEEAIRSFYLDFYQRWSKSDQNDIDMVVFSNNRQQSTNDLIQRDMIMRQHFFEYIYDFKLELLLKDERRAFNESEKIKIYRRDNGLCQICLSEGKPPKEAQVSWSGYQADHYFPHSKGGRTEVENGQVLCVYHNQKKSALLPNQVAVATSSSLQ